ncbi:MAG: alpha/beta fold hydrolase [Spongiibacteraceae bacterium]
MTNYQPPLLLRNPHIQSIFASTAPRKWVIQRRAKELLQASTTCILDCGEGIRLQGEYASKPKNQHGLVILIHGWLGGHNSLYLLSAGQYLFQRGYNVFRLNLRDHGDSNHLNKALFNSTRINEVVNAIKAVQQQFPHTNNYLAGFSLGGNFALRVAAQAPKHAIKLDQVVAICPVINPHKTNRNLHDGLFIYHNYFKKKWQRSLMDKLRHYPEHNYGETLSTLTTLDQMNQYFVPNHTDFNNVTEYLNGYSISGDHLANLSVPCHIISSADDPIIRAEDLQELANNPKLSIELTRHGGHCGYINDYGLNSWVDGRLMELFS